MSLEESVAVCDRCRVSVVKESRKSALLATLRKEKMAPGESLSVIIDAGAMVVSLVALPHRRHGHGGSRRASLPSLGGTSVSLVRYAPQRTSAPPRPGVGHPVAPAGKLPRKRQDLPSFLGNPECPFAHVPHRRRRDRWRQTVTALRHGPWSSNGKGSRERSFDAQ